MGVGLSLCEEPMENTSASSDSTDEFWMLLGNPVPKVEVVFFTQIIIIYIVIITCIVNLSISNGDSSLWIALLSNSLGYVLPNPSVKRSKVVVNRPPQV